MTAISIADRPSQQDAEIARAITLSGVRRTYGRGRDAVVALDGIDLSVEEGELVTLVGASGCGKSTLLSLIAGLDRPTAGTVEVGGGQPALMFQESALFPWLTAKENLTLALKLAGVPRQERGGRAEELLEVVRLGGYGGRRVHELSGGQRQRVALARSLSQGARVLLMDEPFAALDAITRDVLHTELTAVWQQTGISIVFVTHNVSEAVLLGQRVVLLSSRPGRIKREWQVDGPHPRSLRAPSVAELVDEVTAALREEIAAHAKR